MAHGLGVGCFPSYLFLLCTHLEILVQAGMDDVVLDYFK